MSNEQEKKWEQENAELEARCVPLIPAMRELMKAEVEERANRHALSLAIRAGSGTAEDAEAIAMLVDRRRWAVGLLSAKRLAFSRAAKDAGFADRGRWPNNLGDAVSHLRNTLTHGSTGLADRGGGDSASVDPTVPPKE